MDFIADFALSVSRLIPSLLTGNPLNYLKETIMFYLFICCRNHYIKIGFFKSFEEADKQARFHSANCGDSILFEVWHKQTVVSQYVDAAL